MSGLPGSGKSYYANHYGVVGDFILPRDDFRQSLRNLFNTTDYFPCSAAEEYKRWTDTIIDYLTRFPDTDLWIDQTTLTQKAFNKLMDVLLPYVTKNDMVTVEAVHTNILCCLSRNEKREGFEKVPENVIRDMENSMRGDPITTDGINKRYPSLYATINHIVSMEG